VKCLSGFFQVSLFPYSLRSVGPGADPGVQAVSLQVTVSHPPGGRLPLFSARPVVIFPVAEHYCALAGTKLYCLVTDHIGVNNLPKFGMPLLPGVDLNPQPVDPKSNALPVAPPRILGPLIYSC